MKRNRKFAYHSLAGVRRTRGAEPRRSSRKRFPASVPETHGTHVRPQIGLTIASPAAIPQYRSSAESRTRPVAGRFRRPRTDHQSEIRDARSEIRDRKPESGRLPNVLRADSQAPAAHPRPRSRISHFASRIRTLVSGCEIRDPRCEIENRSPGVCRMSSAQAHRPPRHTRIPISYLASRIVDQFPSSRIASPGTSAALSFFTVRPVSRTNDADCRISLEEAPIFTV